MTTPAPEPLLRGIRVVELSRLIAGPFCGLTLADLGADVVKVESPAGDDTRRFPPLLDSGDSAFFHALNRGKRSVVLRLADADGAAAARSLIEGADVVVENLGDAAEHLGIDHARASLLNPRLVWCTITGLGAGREGRALDPSLQASMGLMALTGEPDRPPARVPVPLIDFMTGMYAAQRVLGALWHVERGGRGARLDCALVDAAATLCSPPALLALGGFATPRRMGAESWLVVPAGVFEAADGRHVQMVALTDEHWRALCVALEHPEWIEDERCRDNSARLAHRDLVNTRLAEAIATRRADHWVATITAAGGMAAPVREIEEAWSDPLLVERGLLGSVAIEGGESFPLPVVSLARTANPAALQPAPKLGQHTEEVLGEAGIDLSAETP